MRPPGVRQRVKDLLAGEWDLVHSRPERLLRVHLASFVTLSARLRYYDLPATTVLKRFADVCGYLDDPSQVLTHSDFEDRSLACARRLHPDIAQIAGKPVEEITLEDEDATREPLVRIPPLVLLGEAGLNRHFELVCWNEANSLIEGFQTPYRAARQIANMGFHRPDDPFGMVAVLDALAMRYEDYPEQRGDVADEIDAVLRAYVARAPWGGG